MGNDDDWDVGAAFDRWMADLLARRARGDDKAVLRGLYEAYQRLEEVVERHPEARDELLALLDELRNALFEEWNMWQRQRRQ